MDKLGCRAFIAPTGRNRRVQIEHGRLANLLTTTILTLDKPDIDRRFETEETREEKRTVTGWTTYKGVSPTSTWLSQTGGRLIIFQCTILLSSLVRWRGTKSRNLTGWESSWRSWRDCNYVVDLGRKQNSVSIAGQDILTGTRPLTWALVWQLMRSTPSSLSNPRWWEANWVREIVQWWTTNQGSRKTSIGGFPGPSIATGLPLIWSDRLDQARLLTEIVCSPDTEDKIANAKYGIRWPDARSPGLRPARGHCRGETEDGDDGVRNGAHVQGLYPQHWTKQKA